MRNLLKLFTASLLTVCLSIATVMCCCSASAVVAHFHKTTMCGHCSDKGSHNNNPSNTDATCKNQLTSAEFSNTQAITSSIVSNVSFPALIFLDKHITTLPPPTSLAYPPGSPPQGISFTPLYLRTFNLRI